MTIQILGKQINADLSFNANRSPNMNFKWMLYHESNWLYIMRPCIHSVSKHLEYCFIRKNNFLPVVMQMVICPRQANILCFLDQKRDFQWMLYHESNWLYIMRPCIHSVS